jgi:5-methylcytosine-specific restriction endonuclease McrA
MGTWARVCYLIAGNLKTRKGYPVGKVCVRPKDLLGKLKQQGYRCAYSGDQLTPENLSADHVIPVQRGGSHELSNIRLVTREINRAKATFTLDEFVALCKKVVAHAENGGLVDQPRDTQASERCLFDG